ncbi:hypothetical protein [Priestia abyssalis]|uniref:hypothetical protein n=1 Tax=Priestia abyssalis TaxID=1221450 RepID=UPI00099553BB|nr:hypothetical protein [Priestia abyssalis]
MLTTLTLDFHIIFATIGVGVPVMISIAELIGIKKPIYHQKQRQRFYKHIPILKVYLPPLIN